MPQPNKIPLAFAASGDKNTIPENTETTGLASWREGFPAITSAPFSEGGIAPKRADFNGIFNALSLATVWQQQGGFYAYDATTDYEVGNVVEYNNDLYKCITANGPGSAVKAPTDTTVWSKVMTSADAAALYLPLSGGTLTGMLRTKDIYMDSAAIRANADTQPTMLYGGVGWAHGAQGVFYGKDDTNNPGSFSFRADNGAISSTLVGRPDGTLTWGEVSIVNNGAFNKMFFSQTSGSYTAPYTGVYRITLKGGGGGGSYQSVSAYNSWTGAGGGEGGTLIFYKTLTKDQSYPYAIGAGGAAGTGSTDALSPGQSGGASNFNNSEYVASGGGGAPAAGYSDMGGDGGHTYTAPSGAAVFFIPGQTGQSGFHFLPSALSSTEGYPVRSVSGGGQTARYNQPRNNCGEGGNGGAIANPTAGGSGFILIEYAG